MLDIMRRRAAVCTDVKACILRPNNGRGNMSSKPKRPVQPLATEGDSSMVYPFREEDYRKGVALLKNKAAGRYVLVEQLKNLGPKAHMWLLTMLRKYLMENKITTLWRQSKIIFILNHVKNLCNSKATDQYNNNNNAFIQRQYPVTCSMAII